MTDTRTKPRPEGSSGPGTGADKRVTDRARRRLMVRYGTTAADKLAFTKNISATGMFLQTNSVFRPGTTLQCELEVAGRAFTLWARVIWAKKVPPELAHVLGCGMGLHLLDPPPEWSDAYAEWAAKQGVAG